MQMPLTSAVIETISGTATTSSVAKLNPEEYATGRIPKPTFDGPSKFSFSDKK